MKGFDVNIIILIILSVSKMLWNANYSINKSNLSVGFGLKLWVVKVTIRDLLLLLLPQSRVVPSLTSVSRKRERRQILAILYMRGTKIEHLTRSIIRILKISEVFHHSCILLQLRLDNILSLLFMKNSRLPKCSTISEVHSNIRQKFQQVKPYHNRMHLRSHWF